MKRHFTSGKIANIRLNVIKKNVYVLCILKFDHHITLDQKGFKPVPELKLTQNVIYKFKSGTLFFCELNCKPERIESLYTKTTFWCFRNIAPSTHRNDVNQL